MTRQHSQWKRNTEGLRKSAQEKAVTTKRRVEEAIRLLIKERCTINFKTVSETARVSTAWLYANEEIKLRINHLRSQQDPKAQVRIPPQEQASKASREAVTAALQTQIKKQAAKIKELNEQLEIANGQLRKFYLQE